MRVFISVGMNGRSDEDVKMDIWRAMHYWSWQDTPDGTAIEVIDNWDCQAPEGAGRLWYLGEAIKKLGSCDVCYFCKGWQEHKGCCAEYEICKLYGISMVFEEEA